MSRNSRSGIRRVVVFCVFFTLIPIIAVAQWNYQDVGNYGYWKWGSTDRFKYDYGAKQWWDFGAYGVWRTLGASGWSAATQHSVNDPNFVGNGGWHDVATGSKYKYFSSGGYSNWLVNNNLRFAYTYGTGLWADYSPAANAWSLISTGVLSSTFLGDGAWHTLGGTGFRYRYERSGDYSNWLVNNNMRFAYTYGTGRWADYSSGANTWSMLGSGVLSSTFLGDGGWHGVGNSWWYRYERSGDFSNWVTNNHMRFAYTYSSGQWADCGANTWCLLGPTRVSSAFLGDGNWHTLDSIWVYAFFDDIGWLTGDSVSTWSGAFWSPGGGTVFSCDYTTGVFGLKDSGVTSSVFGYDYNEIDLVTLEPYDRWWACNYNFNSRSETSAANVIYEGSATHSVSSWLSWLPVNPNPGAITRTETWDFTNNDWANRYNHEVRAFANNTWLPQREQGDYGNCGIIASIDSFEARSGLYVGYTRTWHDAAVAHGWADSGGGTYNWQQAYLMEYMGQQFNSPVTADYGDTSARSLSNLVSLVSQGQKVVINVDLSYISEFGTSGMHAVALVGDYWSNDVHYAEITNHWNVQSNTNEIWGMDPTYAYPITLIPFSELQSAYRSYARIQ
jgi:hypothetical protein